MKIIVYIRAMPKTLPIMVTLFFTLFSFPAFSEQKGQSEYTVRDFISYLINNNPEGVKSILQQCDKCLQDIDPL
ncbi:TPA: hypothetical protein ACIAR9_004887, partial [Salmonella enterica subsp. enterica serovar Poona]